MKIKVRTQSMGDIDVDIPDTSRVSALRPIVAEHTGLDAATLRFIFHGRVLDDEDSLVDRGVKDGTTVIMVTRRPPGTAVDGSSHSESGRSSSNRQSTTTNLVNAEINIMRSGFLTDREGALTLIRSAVQRFVSPLSTSITWNVDSREDLPQQGDLTILVRLLGNVTNHPSSGARARILRITDILSRIILAMQVIKDELCHMVDDIVERKYIVDDESFARLDECVLRLEETLLVPRNGYQDLMTPHVTFQQEQIVGPFVEPVETPDGASVSPEGRSTDVPEPVDRQTTVPSRNVTRPLVVFRHSTRHQYSQLLDHVVATQADFSTQILAYQTILRNPQIFCYDEYTRCVAQVFQEHTRRMLHCFGHIFHCLSDVSASFENLEADQLRPNVPETESPYRTEAIFRIIALTGEESRIRTLGQQATQAFRSATQPASLQNVRMRLFGDVRVGRLSPNVQVDTRFPFFSTVVPRFGANQPLVQFPAPVTGVAGPLDFNLLQRLFPPNLVNPAASSGGPRPSTPNAPAPSNPSTVGRRTTASTSSGTGSGSAAQSTNSANGSASGGTRRISMLRELFTEAFNHLLANRARSGPSASQVDANPVTSEAASGPPTATSAPSQLSRSGSGSMTFQTVNISQGHSVPGLQPSQISVGPGMIGQLVVETDGPEGARQIINAAMQAANSVMGVGGGTNQPQVGAAISAGPRFIQLRPLPANIIPMMPEARSGQIARMGTPGAPQQWPNGTVYASDRFLPCRSNFASTNAETNRTQDYQTALRTIREAALRYERSLPENSEQRDDAELVSDRWLALRESDERYTRRALGGNVAEIGTMQSDPAQFQRVLGSILERIVHQMAITDPDIAEDLNVTRNDFDNYFNDLTSETRENRNEANEGEDSASTSQRNQEESLSNMPSTSGQNGNVLQRFSSEPTLGTRDSSATTSDGGDAGWTRELQVLRLIADILNAPGGATIGQFLRREGYQYSHAGGGFINLLITMCCEVVDTTDFMRLLSGDLSTFGNYRQQMRRYVIEHILDDNSRPSPEDLENVTRRFQLAESLVNRLFEADPSFKRFVDVPEIGRVDIAASALNIDRLFLRNLLSLVVSNPAGLSAEDFSKRMSEMFSGFFRRFVAIANLSSNSPTGYTDVLMQLTNNTGLHDEQTQTGASVSNMEAENDYLLMRNLMQSSLPRLEAYLRLEAPFNLVDIANELILVDASAEELSWSSDSAETKTCEDEGKTVKTTENASSPKQGPSNIASGSTQDYRVFPESWVSVIENDICRQSTLPVSRHLSAAYLSGDPYVKNSSKKTDDGCACLNNSNSSASHDCDTINEKNSNETEASKKKRIESKTQKDEPDSAAMEVDFNGADAEHEKSSKPF